MKIVRESKSEVSQNTPPNENCHRVQIRGVPEYLPNENCQRVQIQGVPEYPPPKLKTLVFFPKSKFHVTQNTP